MLKITEKVTRYDIENLNEKDYSILKSLFLRNFYDGGMPPIKFAAKVLKKEDVIMMYQVTEEYLDNLTQKD